MLTVTNNNNGVSVDKSFSSLAALRDLLTAADAVKELINIVRGYESDEETNVCGWVRPLSRCRLAAVARGHLPHQPPPAAR